MKKILFIFFLISLTLKAQPPVVNPKPREIDNPLLLPMGVLIIQGQSYTNTNSTWWDGVNIPRNEPTTFTFKNNSITSRNGNGYMLQAGDEVQDGPNVNNLDGAKITGNKFIWNGVNTSENICHGLFVGCNKNYIIKWNYIYRAPTAVVYKSRTMGNTDNNTGFSYNILNNPTTIGVGCKAFDNVRIYNNTFYSSQPYGGDGAATTGGLVNIYTNYWDGNTGHSSGIKIKNNIFYTVHDIASIYIETVESLVGFESDYNVFWCEAEVNGSPWFEYLGEWLDFEEWQSLGYDLHSVVMNPEFNADFVPENRLDYGTNLGSYFQTGLSVSATWNVGSAPATTIQNGVWQVGARIYGGATGITKIYEDPKEEKKETNYFGCSRTKNY